MIIRSKQEQFGANKGFACALRWQKKLIGVIGANEINWSNRQITLGYWLSEAAQGQGLMSAAVAALVRHALEDLKLQRIEIRCASENLKSRALPERLGFTLEGRLRSAELLYGRFVDHCVYSKIAADS